jgi:DNA-binding SARP family transcriptional activator
VEAGVVAGVESRMESDRSQGARVAGIRLQMLGPMLISRGGVTLALPQSRKVRALIAYLALASYPVARSRLCELLWDVPNDPRGELRWCLSKVRGVLDQHERSRVITSDDTIKLDLDNCFVDAVEIDRAIQQGIEMLDPARLRALSALFAGDLLEGLEIARSGSFSTWLIAQRRRFRASHAAILEHLVRRLPRASDEAVRCLEKWLQLSPFDRCAHEMLLDALAERGRIREGEEHLAAAARLFEDEALDWAPIGYAWRAAKARHASVLIVPDREGAFAHAAPVASNTNLVPTAPRRASLAVMPFADLTRKEPTRGGLADGLAHDVITRLAKLRSLFVIGQGTVFALDQRSVGPEEAGRTLNVDYVASGSLRRERGRVVVSVQLAETRTARIVWADDFAATLDDAFGVLDEIGDRIVSAIDNQIEMAERNRAILKAPSSLDAWEAYHRGLWHMYRFNRPDNDSAQHFFETAVRLDPTFARPYAGLSFTHFQNAFQGWGERHREVELAFRTAAQSLMVDDRDPAAHWAIGRALWLRGRMDESLVELDTSVELSPNFALGHYTLAFVHSQSGDAQAAIRSSDHSRELSPFDPLLFGMLGSRAMALVRLGQFDEAAKWALKASARPNAHVHIFGIAAFCLALADRCDEARAVAASIQSLLPRYHIDEFLAAFRFSEDAEALFRRGAQRIGMG